MRQGSVDVRESMDALPAGTGSRADLTLTLTPSPPARGADDGRLRGVAPEHGRGRPWFTLVRRSRESPRN